MVAYIDPHGWTYVLLNHMLDSFHKNHYVFLLGDFNVDLSPAIETTAAVDEFKNIFCSHHLYSLINKPTRDTKSSKTIIDNIYCNIPHVLNLSNIGIILTYISDHHAIFCLFNETKTTRLQTEYDHETQFL